ncbi:MAG: hypothetical protein ACOCR6_00370 [archaeon]
MAGLLDPVASFIRWLPSEFSTWSVLRREAKARLVRPLVRRDYEPISYVERDWDTLVILDACRYDVFPVNNPFPVEVERVYSNASHTRDFLRKNFAGDHPDTVYVTASPQVANYGGNFAHVEHVWRDGWNDATNTVLPETVTERALSVAETYPHKRLVVHYMQPHYPFIGPTGTAFGEQGSFLDGRTDRSYPSVWERLDAGLVDADRVREAYVENLEAALPAVQELVDGISGKTVVTSDHGNLFGKRVSWLPIEIYGHPPGIFDTELTSVPWVELPYDERREITEASTETAVTGDGDVEDRLESLGYV